MAKHIHNREFYKHIVELERAGTKLSLLLEQYKITRSSFYYWKKQFEKEEEGIDESSEVAKLKKENARLELENEILKKAVAIIGRNS